MNALLRWLSIVVLAAAPAAWGALPPGSAAGAGARAAVTQAEDPEGARVIVKYKALGSLMRADRVALAARRGSVLRGPQHAAAMSLRSGLPLRDGRVIDGQMQVLWGGTDITAAALAQRLAADPDVEYAVPDRRRHALAVPNDPLYAAGAGVSPATGQWYLRAPDATLVSAINAAGAWDVTHGSASIVVADLDSGVLFDHPDLAAKLHAGYDFITPSSTAGDGGGRDADATDPGDWTTTGQCGTGVAAEASSWHGTQTAGLIGAHTDNGVGMASVGRNVMVLPVRVLGKCGGADSDIVAAMLWAGGVSSIPAVNAHPARVINLSLGGTGACSAAYVDAVNRLTAAGVVVVAAAGNDEGLAVATPANCAGVIAVAGVRHTGTKVGFSSLGPQVAVSAPAGNCVTTGAGCIYPILTTTNAGTQTATTHTYSNGSNYSVGTSFAAPLVSGTVALMLSAHPALTPAAVKTLLQGSARGFPTTADAGIAQCRAPSSVAQGECICTTSTCGAGLLDAAGAVAAAAAAAGVADPTAAVASSATSVVAGATVTFDGSASAAGSGRTIAAWRWAITSGSGIASFSGATDGATARVVTQGAGSFTVQLTVTDSAGRQGTATSTVVVGVPAAPNVVLLASAQVVGAGAAVTFDGSGSAAAAGLAIAAWQWTIDPGTGLASFTSATNGPTAAVATNGAGSGSFTVRLTVTDSLGRQSTSSATVTVTAVTPLASLAASALTVTAGGSVTFDAAGSTAPVGRTITAYQWAVTSGGTIAALSGSATGSAATAVTTGAGSFTIRLTVTDSAGAQDSRSATVAVQAAPVAAAGGGSSSGGGGASGAGWALALALAAAALQGATTRPPRR